MSHAGMEKCVVRGHTIGLLSPAEAVERFLQFPLLFFQHAHRVPGVPVGRLRFNHFLQLLARILLPCKHNESSPARLYHFAFLLCVPVTPDTGFLFCVCITWIYTLLTEVIGMPGRFLFLCRAENPHATDEDDAPL